MNKGPKIFIEHILESISLIESFSKGLKKSDFLKNKLKQNAIIRQIEIMGEAVKNIPEPFKVKYPSVEWKKIAGVRDKLIHHYFGVDIDTVWDILEHDLPNLKKDIEKILKDLE